MAVLIMFEKAYKGGLLRCMFDEGSTAPFNFWFIKKDGESLVSPLYKTLEEGWQWVEKGMRT